MKLPINALAQITIVVLLVSFTIVKGRQAQSQEKEATPVATCYGKKDCSACKNCKYCKHCSKDGGTCGVCK